MCCAKFGIRYAVLENFGVVNFGEKCKRGIVFDKYDANASLRFETLTTMSLKS